MAAIVGMAAVVGSRRIGAVAVRGPMFQTIVIRLMAELVMESAMLTVRHRIPVRLSVIQLTVVSPVIKIVVMPRMIRVGAGVAKVNLSLGRCGKQGDTDHPQTCK